MKYNRYILISLLFILALLGCKNRKETNISKHRMETVRLLSVINIKNKLVTPKKYILLNNDAIIPNGYTSQVINYDSLSVKQLPSIFTVSRDGKYGYAYDRKDYESSNNDNLQLTVIDLLTHKVVAKSSLNDIINSSKFEKRLTNLVNNSYWGSCGTSGYLCVLGEMIQIFPSSKGIVLSGSNNYSFFISNRLKIEKIAHVDAYSNSGFYDYCVDYGDSALFTYKSMIRGIYRFKNAEQDSLYQYPGKNLIDFSTFSAFSDTAKAYYNRGNLKIPKDIGYPESIFNNKFLYVYINEAVDENPEILIYDLKNKKVTLVRSKSFAKLHNEKSENEKWWKSAVIYKILGINDKAIYIGAVNTSLGAEFKTQTVFTIPNILKNVR